MNKKLTTVQKTSITFGFLALILVGFFQNCGAGFSLDPVSLTQVASTSTAVAGATAESFKMCRSGSASLYLCLESSSAKKGVLKEADVAACAGASAAPTDLELAMCITRSGFPIFNYREPTQFDVEACSVKVGTSKIAACLEKNGIRPAAVTQEVVETCVNAAGIANVEKCLRKNGHLVRTGYVSNSDFTFCTKVTDQGTNSAVLLTCLSNREVLPATVVQADIDTCLTNAPTTMAKCLRTARKVSRAIMQANINGCNAAVGPTKIAACLDANGYLYDGLLPAATLQTAIDSCLAAAGLAGTAKCLRARDVLEKPVMQPQIAACGAAVGYEKTVACLTANGMLDAAGLASNSIANVPLLQTDVDTCLTSAGAIGIGRCLANVRQVLMTVPKQAQFAACHRFGDPTGLAACLDASGILPTGVTQANFNTCLTASGLAGLETCMRTRGFIP